MNTLQELKEMSDEQLDATEAEAASTLFRLRFQSQSERLNTPSEIKKNRRMIARIKTLRTLREKEAAAKATPAAEATSSAPAETTTAS